MPERDAREVRAFLAVVAHDHAHVADGNDGLGNDLDGGEPAIDEIGAVDQGHELSPAAAARGQERFDVLVVVDGRRDQLAGRERRTVMHRDDGDRVLAAGFAGGCARCADHDRPEAVPVLQLGVPRVEPALFVTVAQVQSVDHVFGGHHELDQVDRVHPFAQDRALAATLSEANVHARFGAEERSGVLEYVNPQ